MGQLDQVVLPFKYGSSKGKKRALVVEWAHRHEKERKISTPNSFSSLSALAEI